MRDEGPATRHRTRRLKPIQLMVGLVIVGVIAAAGTLTVMPHCTFLKADQARLDIDAIGKVLRLYAQKTGHYPDPAVGLDELVRLQYLSRLPLDPWGRAYLYTLDRDGPTVMSLGRDGAPGGTGPDADLSSRAPAAEGVSSR